MILVLLLGVARPCASQCDNTCVGNPSYAADGDCDDGGPDSDFGHCSYGTDCIDCGTRVMPPPQPQPPLPPPLSPPSPPPPLPPFACACEAMSVVIPGDALIAQPGPSYACGSYVKMDGVTRDGRAVYQQSGGSNYLYFSAAYSDWLVGSDYTSNMAGLASSFHQANKTCPEAVGSNLWWHTDSTQAPAEARDDWTNGTFV